jgi:tetratricopeptide (TPR) repeat protein
MFCRPALAISGAAWFASGVGFPYDLASPFKVFDESRCHLVHGNHRKLIPPRLAKATDSNHPSELYFNAIKLQSIVPSLRAEEHTSVRVVIERHMKSIFASLFARKRAGNAHDNTAKSGSKATFKRGDVVGGEYEIYKLLGEGGFGEVYLARQRESGVPCALKTIRTELLVHAASREAFKREALLWINLEQHPFILVARVVREFSRRLFVGMEYIGPDARGRTSLADHLATTRGPLDKDRSLKWAIQFCYGMEHALQRGIKCHRDIKPTNALITQDGILKITDFGLALGADAAWKEKTGSVVTQKDGGSFGLSLLQADGRRVCGTPGYIAPEIFLGKQADERSDIYSFGLVLWQMAKGSSVPPFHVPYEKVANIEEYLRRVFDQQMEKHVPDAGGPMQLAIERCLIPEPSQRYASFEELRRELELICRRRTGSVVEPPKAGARTAGFWNNRGLSLDELGRHEEAIVCYAKALEIDSRDVNTWSNKGSALGALGRHQEAIACLDKALHLDAESAPAWSNKGSALDALGRYEEALACFAKALQVDPQNSVIWNNKGNALYALARYDEALTCFAESARIDPHYASAWTGQALALRAKGRHKEAGACLAKAEEIDPQCPDDWKRVAAAGGDHQTALNSFKRDAATWGTRGTDLLKAGLYEEALASFARALEIDTRFGGAWYNRGSAFSSLGRHEEALTCYTQALDIDPQLFDAWERKAHALALLGRHEEAVTCFTKALELAPQSIGCWNNKGKTLEALGRLDEAIPCFTKALDIDPSRAVIWDNKGVALRGLGQHQEALACASRALEIEPGNPYFWSNKGAALRELGQLEEAVHCYARAVEIDPKHASAWNNKGTLLGVLGRLNEAVPCFDRALEIDPHSTAALNNKRKAIEIAQSVPEISDEDIPF